MAFDIIIGSSLDEAFARDSDLEVEDYIHDDIFLGPTELQDIQKWPDGKETKHYHYPKEREREWLKKYPLFYRMKDQYCDHIIYHHDEIIELMKELEEIKKLENEPNLSNFAEQLINVCEKALNSNQKIYCFGD